MNFVISTVASAASNSVLSAFCESRLRELYRWSVFFSALAVAAALVPQRGEAQIKVDPNTEGVTNGSACSLQEAIYATNFGTNVALDQTDPDDTYYTGCSDPSGAWNVIDLPGGTLKFTKYWDGDSHNPFGPTATPIIFKAITIRGHGTTLQWAWTSASPTTGNFRLFAVGQATIPNSGQPLTGVIGGSYQGTGNLTLQDVYVKGFNVKGGDGGDGGAAGGGGLGAGGAIYIGKVSSGVPSLTVVNSTFDSNGAVGGNGGKVNNALSGGGGGGLGGNGGLAQDNAGGGGGGSRGDGGAAVGSLSGGGGGTVYAGGKGFCDVNGNCSTGQGGYLCGGDSAGEGADGNGAPGQCPGGGGGGGHPAGTPPFTSHGDGGSGAYGGGGGGGEGSGHVGGFGGGGGGGYWGDSGFGGFGGGGGGKGCCGDTGVGGLFGGHGDSTADSSGNIGFGGGGGALGGAIFNDSGTVVVQNSTFFNNFVSRGAAGGGNAANGGDSGGAIFSRNGSLTVENSTVNGNQATGAGGGIVVFGDNATATFVLDNTIIANNGAQECITDYTLAAGAVSQSGKNNLIRNNKDCPTAGILAYPPQLGPLQINAPGNTPTMALLSGSPGIGQADPNTSLSTDQRGVQRKATPDIGAYETVPTADLSLSKSVSSGTAKAGDLVTYTLSVTNLGPDDASTVTVTDSLPADLTYSACTASAGGSCSSQGGTFSSLAANATATITLSGTLNSGITRGTVVTNSASVQASSPDDFTTSNNSASASFTVIVPDFSLSAVSPITVPVGSSGTSTLTVSSIDTFSSAVSLTTTGPSNFQRTFSANPVTPPSNGSTTSTLKVTLEPSVTAGTYTVNETGTSGNLTHSASVTVKVQTTIAGTSNVINSDLKLGAIDNAGVATALTSKLAVAQSAQTAGQLQTEINTLQALLSQLNAQSGKHIKTSWLDGSGQSFNPAAVLIGDVTDLLSNAGANLNANPIVGNVVNAAGAGVSGLTVNVLNSKNVTIVSATTDVTGFYYFPTTNALAPGANYTVKVTVPKTYRNSSPSSQSFSWKSMAVSLNNFVLN